MDIRLRKISSAGICRQSFGVGRDKFIFFGFTGFFRINAVFGIYIYINKKQYNLKNLASVLSFVTNINHVKQKEYALKFPWAAKISFYTHSFLLSACFGGILYFISSYLFLSFLIGYFFHLLIDILLHNDFFSSKPLYPLSNFTIRGFMTWYKVKNFLAYNFGLLMVLYLAMFL